MCSRCLSSLMPKLPKVFGLNYKLNTRYKEIYILIWFQSGQKIITAGHLRPRTSRPKRKSVVASEPHNTQLEWPLDFLTVKRAWGSHLSEDSEVEFRKPVYLRKVFSPIPVQAKVNSIMWTSAPSTETAPQDQIKSVLSTHFFFFKQSALGIDRCYCYYKVKLHSHLTKMCLIKKQKNGYLELC